MQTSTKTSVLILDGDNHSRCSIATYLQKKGCYVVEAEGQMEALQALSEKEMDVVLLSLSTLREESMTVLKRITELCPATKIILLTSLAEISLSIKGMKLGAFDDLLVPIDLAVLFSRVEAAREKKMEEGANAARKDVKLPGSHTTKARLTAHTRGASGTGRKRRKAAPRKEFRNRERNE